MSKWIIVYCGGDRSKLTTVEICEGLEYEISDYAVASRRDFSDKTAADDYCRQLARTNNLKVTGDVTDYLD